MASLDLLPAELIVKIMVFSALEPKRTNDPYQRRTGSFRHAYALAITSKKHYACFKDQQCQIFSAIAKAISQPYKGRYNITLTLGDLQVVSKCPTPGYDPVPLELVFKGNTLGPGLDAPELPQPKIYAAILGFLRRKDLQLLLFSQGPAPCRGLGRVEQEDGFKMIMLMSKWVLIVKVGTGKDCEYPMLVEEEPEEEKSHYFMLGEDDSEEDFEEDA